MMSNRVKSFSGILASLLLAALIQDAGASDGCCSQSYKDCDASWCGDTEEACESCDTPDMRWLENGQIFSCIGRYRTCTNEPDGCCEGLKCEGGNFYKQCVVDPDFDSDDDGDGGGGDDSGGDDDVTGGCCSQNYRDCDAAWCGISKNQCDNCDGSQLIYLEDGANTSGCQERWSTCTDNPDACCPGLECKFISTFYSQCLPAESGGVTDDDEPDDPTESPVTDDPTESPVTDDPTESPVVSREPCEDNPDDFFYKGKDTSCAEISALGEQKRRRKCRDGRRLIEECPAVCEEDCATSSPTETPREQCVDNPDDFEFKGVITSCDEIAALGPQKLRRKCNDGRRIEDECPTVCNPEECP
eukprot:CAMPEP_0197178566 /NCGR_PEP_ID=MMETSP1423-20130617/3810_1 /TAXON_ID=476441 /ORGANISM="Pseudo-nitzschia heimii, Strain UNC1101" /LENGTH=358 /DNA_ID=CAMNT_0042628341 /DNA_START=20 /DNA_END=1096 /DNA_ORIENTATION=+